MKVGEDDEYRERGNYGNSCLCFIVNKSLKKSRITQLNPHNLNLKLFAHNNGHVKSFFKRTPENEIVVQYHITTKEKDLSGLHQEGDWFLRQQQQEEDIVLPVEFNPYLPTWKVFQYELNKTKTRFQNTDHGTHPQGVHHFHF